MKLKIIALGVVVLVPLVFGCGGNSDPSSPGGNDAPSITGVDPADVTAGTVVTVTGKNFGSTGQLLVNGSEVATTSWSDTTIVFTVPAGLAGTEIQVQVTSGGRTTAQFTVPYTAPVNVPVITSVDPASLSEGIVATLTGQNFGASGELRLNDDLVATTLWTDTLIMFTVPTGIYATQAYIYVTSGGQNSALYQVPFTAATERQLTFDGMECYFPCWSAAGDAIYFEAQAPDGTTAFFQVPVDGGETTLLYNGPGNDRMLDVQYYQAGALIWISDRDDGGNSGGDWEVREGSSGFNPQRFLETFPGSNDDTERLPVWSHTEHLNVDCAWTQDRLAGGSQIYVRRLASLVPLVAGFSPCFNPDDGHYLAYLTESPTTGYDIMKVQVDEDPEPELIYRDESTGMGRLAWGKGGRIAYKKGQQIWIMDDDGTNHRKLTDSNSQEAYPRFSPNGNWVVFSRLVNTGFEIFVAKVP